MNVAFIPVRGGSKSIPLKNIKPISGRPLVYWTVRAACGCASIHRVYVATDSEKIRETVESFREGEEAGLFAKVEVIGRSAESACDTASTESAMLEFAEKYDFDNIVLIQATSPLLRAADLDRGFETYGKPDTDSVLSVVRQKRFHWAEDAEGIASPTNYDVYHRPRRQEFDGYLVENGAFYICSKEGLLRSKNRVSGRIRAVEMNEDTFFEIDEPSDWVIIEALMKKNGIAAPEASGGSSWPTADSAPAEAVVSASADASQSSDAPALSSELQEIRMLLTDCDGCLTDGGMYYSEHGDELKKFNTRDGMGFALLREKGIVTGIVTGESVDLNRRRAEKLKLDVLEAGCKDKPAAIRRIAEAHGIPLSRVCYIGDDINDAEALRLVGFGCAPADAQSAAKEAADYVTRAKGGEGVIREVVEMLLRPTASE